MSHIAYVNGAYLPHYAAGVHIEDRGYQFADGVYEYIAFYNGRLVDAEPHFRRLQRSAAEIELGLPMKIAPMMLVAKELIARNGRNDGGLYIQVTRGVARRDHPYPKHTRPALVMTVCRAKLPTAAQMKEGVRVITRPDIRWARRDIKSVSLLPNVLARQAAAEQGAREAWLLDGEIVTEGSASNSYIIDTSGALVTHPANEFILGGIAREVVLRLAAKAGVRVVEKAFTLDDVKAADEAFLTSTSANVLPVVAINESIIGAGRPGPVTRKLSELYNDHIFTQTGKKL